MIVEAYSLSDAIELYPHKVNDIVTFNNREWVVTEICVTMPSRPKDGKPGLFDVSHSSEPYSREVELLHSATGVVYASRGC